MTGLVRIATAAVLAFLLLAPATAGAPAEGRGTGVLATSGGEQPVPCPAVDTEAEPYIEGGCRAMAYDFDMVLSVRTMFGAVHFGDCVTSFAATFAADGRFWFDDLKIGGAAPCNDTWPCSPPAVIAMRKKRTDAPPRGKVPPWHGRLVAADDGSFRGSFGFCIDTCLGRYRGNVDLRLVRNAEGRWEMRAASEGVGVGSMEVDAKWDLIDPEAMVGPADVDFQTAGR